MTTSTRSGDGPESWAYTWDLRGRLVDAARDVALGVVHHYAYAYDHDGQRVARTDGNAAPTLYLHDWHNPTGHPQAVEERTAPTPAAPAGAAVRSYLLGLRVEAQSDATHGLLRLAKDAHGSTRALVAANGTIPATGAAFDHQAYGEPIAFDPATAKTVHLFAGDGEYDPGLNLTYHDARWRGTHRFVSFDPGENDFASPLHLHKYLYTGGNPILAVDPSGNDFGFGLMTLGVSSILASIYISGALQSIGYDAVDREFYDAFKGIPFIGSALTLGEGLYNGNFWQAAWGGASLGLDLFGGALIGRGLGAAGRLGGRALSPLTGKLTGFRATALSAGGHAFSKIPNPFGRLGNLVTQKTVNGVIKKLRELGYTRILREVRFRPGPGALKTRFADVVGVDPITGQRVIVQVGEISPRSGLPISREGEALLDIVQSPDFNPATDTIVFVEKGT